MTNTLDRTRQELDKLLADSTVLHAVVGAGDLAVAKLRETHSELSARTGNFDPKVIREQAQATLLTRVSNMPQDVKAAPQQVRVLPEKAQAVIGDAVASSFSVYGKLANRGKTLVERLRKQPETADVQTQTTVDLATAGSAEAAADTDSAFRPPLAAREAEAATDQVGKRPVELPPVSGDN